MKKRFKKIWDFLKDTFDSYSSHDSGTMAAALSYYTVFSIAPVLVIIIAVVGLIFGHDAVSGQIYNQVKGMLGSQSADQLQTMIKASYQPGKNIIATIISLGVLIVGASSILQQLQISLNTIWDVKPKPKLGLMKYIRDRILSFVFILAMGFLLLVSLVVNAAIAGLSGYLMRIFPGYSVHMISLVEFIVSFLIISGLFCMMFKFIPDAKIEWREVRIGGIVTAFLFTVGKYLIGLYLGTANVASAYGAAGSIAIIFIWIYYSSQILFIGAEFTKVYACRDGHIIEPSDYAIKVKTVDLEQKTVETHEDFHERVEKVEKVSKKVEK